MHLQKTALVLEGGGMRGMFSAGVFEAFLAHQLTFPYITAVSAGACNILSYMSAQPLRTRQIIEHYVTDKRYFSVRNWIKSGSIFGFDFIFNELPKQLLPFDYAAYRAYPGVLQVAATDIVNGESGMTRRHWARTLFLCALLPPCPSLPLSSSMKAVRCSTVHCSHPFPTKERSTHATKSWL